MPAVADVARIGGVAVSRAVRDTCIALANASTSRVERVALMAIAFLAEGDESAEYIATRPELDDMDDAARDRFLDRTMDRFMDRTMNASKTDAPKVG